MNGHIGTETRSKLLREAAVGILHNGGNPDAATPRERRSISVCKALSAGKATDRRLGGPLPHQPANQTRVHLIPPEFFTPDHAILCAYAVLAVISNCYPPV